MHRNRTHVRRRLTVGGLATFAVLLVGCADNDQPDAATEPDASEQEHPDEGADAEEPAEPAVDEAATDAEEDPFEEFQSSIDIPEEIAELFTVPDTFVPSTLMTDVEDPGAGTLESRVGGDLSGDPEELIAQVDEAMAQAGLGDVAYDPIIHDGVDRQRHQWEAEADGRHLSADLVVEPGVDGGRLTVAVVRPDQ